MIGLTRLAVAIGLLILIVFGIITLLKKLGAPSLDAAGPKNGVLLGAPGVARLKFAAKGTKADLAHQKWSLDGNPVTPRATAQRLVYRPRNLRDGEHTFEIVATGGFLGATNTKSWSFTVDRTPPRLKLDKPVVSYASEPVVAKGTINEDAVLKANRRHIAVKDGTWRIRYAVPPGTVILTATDKVGNTSRWRLPVTIVPRQPSEPIRAVHMSADAWASSQLRNGVMQMIDEGRINAVELDLKDESGIVGWPAAGAEIHRYGGVQDIYSLADAVKQLHAKGVRVIGRLVAFRDPIVAQKAWAAGRRDEVIQTPSGEPYTVNYGGFGNFANPQVRKYNIAIAVAAAKLGVDDILYDYIRRPDGDLSSMVFPGLKGGEAAAERSVASFLAETQRALQPYHTFLGASVFGIAATHPDEIAQNIPMMSRHLDYVSPMVYPSHWSSGEYSVASPDTQPYDIVYRSLKDFVHLTKGTGARVVPWLQDFTLYSSYGPAQVAAQVKAATDAGAPEFLLWDPNVTYDASGLSATAKMPATGTLTKVKLPADAPGLISLGGSSPAVPVIPSNGGSSAKGPVGTAPPNELGQIPVLMHHQLITGPSSVYDLTPKEFEAELLRLWKDGYVPVNASALVTGKIDIPKGKKADRLHVRRQHELAVRPGAGRERQARYLGRDHDEVRRDACGLRPRRNVLLEQRRIRAQRIHPRNRPQMAYEPRLRGREPHAHARKPRRAGRHGRAEGAGRGSEPDRKGAAGLQDPDDGPPVRRHAGQQLPGRPRQLGWHLVRPVRRHARRREPVRLAVLQPVRLGRDPTHPQRAPSVELQAGLRMGRLAVRAREGSGLRLRLGRGSEHDQLPEERGGLPLLQVQVPGQAVLTA